MNTALTVGSVIVIGNEDFACNEHAIPDGDRFDSSDVHVIVQAHIGSDSNEKALRPVTSERVDSQSASSGKAAAEFDPLPAPDIDWPTHDAAMRKPDPG
ncbi:MAG: hypothetical protein M3O31_15150 [Acidobacteriota bacterium]|nr:hypothetical protein [Acidobacteriota bacterium]